MGTDVPTSFVGISTVPTSCSDKLCGNKHLKTWGSIYPNLKKYFLHVQSIIYFAPKYLRGPFIQLRKNTSCMCKVFNTLHLNTWASLYPTLKKTSCTCKVFINLHRDTWGSIYPTSKKYFLHLQSIQYFAPSYMGVHISNFEKILLTCTKYSILCIYIPGGPYIQLRKILLARAKYSILCT